jgi:hypothetical protein
MRNRFRDRSNAKLVTGLLLLAFGLILMMQPLAVTMQIYNSQVVHNCDTRGIEWVFAYESSGTVGSVDTTDFVEGVGSIKMSWTEAWQFGGYVSLDTRSNSDWSSTPYVSFSIETTVAASTLQLRVQSYNGSGYEYSTFNIPTTTTGWETKEINLLSPIEGTDTMNLNRVSWLWFNWFDYTGIRDMKIDNIIRGTSTPAPTPTPTATPAPSPTSSPAPTPTPEPPSSPPEDEDPTTVQLIITATAGGYTEPSVGMYTYSTGTTVIIEAISNAGYKFERWTTSKSVRYTQPELTLQLDSSLSIQAEFSFSLTPEYVTPEPTTMYVVVQEIAGLALAGFGLLLIKKR